MQTIHQLIPANPALSMGMPWFVVDLPGVRLLMRDGDTFGHHAQLWLAPEHGFAVATLVNAQPSDATVAQAALFEALTRYGLLDTRAASTASPVPIPSPAAPPLVDLDQYASRYEVPGAAYDWRSWTGRWSSPRSSTACRVRSGPPCGPRCHGGLRSR